MKTLMGLVAALALAVSISACGANGVDPCASPTAPGCNGNGGGVPASTVASITGVTATVGGRAITPTVTEENGVKKYTFKTPYDWVDTTITFFNPKADGREVTGTIATPNLSGERIHFPEPMNPNPYVATRGLKPDRIYTVEATEIGGNLTTPTQMKVLVEFIPE